MSHLESRDPHPPAGDDTVARLVRLAPPRPTLPDERLARMKAAVRPEWQQQVRMQSHRRRWRRAAPLLAAAAVLVLAVGTWQLSERRVSPAPVPGGAPVVATLELIDGTALRADGTALATGDTLRAGERLATGEARLALRLASGVSLRLDRGTAAVLESESVLELAAGAVYVDSQLPPGPRPAITLRTFRGTVTDVGTQFEARLTGEALRLRVREGRVRLEHPGGMHEGEAGEELTLEADRLTRRPVPLYGALWDWVVGLAPAPEIDDRPLTEFLGWVVRETGWRLRYATEELAEKAPTVLLHGSIEGLTPDTALTVMLRSCDLGHRLEDGTLVIEPRGSPNY